MTKTLEIHSHSVLTVRRPSGAVESVTSPAKFDDRLFAKAKRDTAAAGRGELLGYVNHTKTVDAPQPSAADIADHQYRARTAAIYRGAETGVYR
jgi:hypothetical protein